MQICFYNPSIKNTQNNAIFGGMLSSFYKELGKCGVIVNFTTELNKIKGDILVVSIGGGQEITAAKAMSKFNGPVILNVYNAYLSFNKSFLKRWKNKILFVYCTDFATLNYKKYSSLNIPYYHFPFGSDDNIFKPLNIEKKYDIAFLGNSSSGFGREKYINLLMSYAKEKKLKVFLAGSGWDKYGYPYNIVEHGDQTNIIYNSSKICINLHNDRQYAGIDIEMDANNRLFDLAMAGCCQISNGEEMILKYFNKNEIVTADEPDMWIQQIDYYLKNESEREQVSIKAYQRAIKDHTWNKRAIEFIDIINENYPLYSYNDQKTKIFNKLRRYLDGVFPPLYLLKEIRIIRFILTKTGLMTVK